MIKSSFKSRQDCLVNSTCLVKSNLFGQKLPVWSINWEIYVIVSKISQKWVLCIVLSNKLWLFGYKNVSLYINWWNPNLSFKILVYSETEVRLTLAPKENWKHRNSVNSYNCTTKRINNYLFCRSYLSGQFFFLVRQVKLTRQVTTPD